MALNLGNADLSLTAAVQTVVQVAALAQLSVIKATATNVDTVPHWVTVWRVGNGGSPLTGNICGADETKISAGETIVLPLSGQALIDQQSFQAACDVDAMVNLNLSYAQTP